MRLPEEYAKYLGLGAEIAGTLLVPIGIGYGVDRFFSTSPFGILIGSVVGIALFFSLVFRLSKQDRKEGRGD